MWVELMKLRKSEFRRYLLADPFSDLHEEVEAWLREADDEAFEKLLGETEDELIDEFVWDELAGDEIPTFENNFLGDPERRRKLSSALSFARAFRDHLEESGARRIRQTEEPLREPLAFRPRLPALFTRPAWGAAMAAALAAVVVGGAWILLNNQLLEDQLVQATREQEALAETEAAARQQFAEQQNRADQIAGELQDERTLRMALQGELESLRGATPIVSIASIWLSPGLMRGGGEMERVVLPEEAILARLLLDLGIDDYANYRAVLNDAAGDELWSQAKLEAETIDGRVAVALSLPADLLPRGDYSIRLSGATASGDLELVGRYYLRVLRK